MERTTRFGQALEFLKYGWDSVIANVVPLVNRYVETLNGERGPKVSQSFATRGDDNNNSPGE